MSQPTLQLNNASNTVNQPKIQTLITDYYQIEKTYGFSNKTNSWHCLVCGDDMGSMNPRQLCGKSKCYNMF